MSQQLKYTVDIVLCIDATGSMGPFINGVKQNGLKFHPDLAQNMVSKGKVIDNLRVKVIVFRDFFADGNNAFKESPFYSLPTANQELANFINSIYADGGGDDPESGKAQTLLPGNSGMHWRWGFALGHAALVNVAPTEGQAE